MLELIPFISNNRMGNYDPFKDIESFEKHFFGTDRISSFKTDIKDNGNEYLLEADLPGFKKEDVQAELKDGYLTVNAETKTETSEGDEKKGTWVRKERFEGKCSRTFYVGEDVKEEDIKARFENGTLVIDVPKPQPHPKLEEKKTIAIA